MTPPDHMVLAAVLVEERRALETLHVTHAQLRLLLEAGDSRYLGWAIDDLAEATEALAEIDRTRRSITADRTAEEYIELAFGDMQQTLRRLTTEIDGLLERIEYERARARSACHQRIRTGRRIHR